MKSLTILSFLWKFYILWWLPPGVCELCSLLAIFSYFTLDIKSLNGKRTVLAIIFSLYIQNQKEPHKISLSEQLVLSMGGIPNLKLENPKQIWAMTCDFQQCGIFTCVDSDELLQPLFKLRFTLNDVRSVA